MSLAFILPQYQAVSAMPSSLPRNPEFASTAAAVVPPATTMARVASTMILLAKRINTRDMFRRCLFRSCSFWVVMGFSFYEKHINSKQTIDPSTQCALERSPENRRSCFLQQQS
mmetsp:Transcript_5469/g.11911  ORF Transcript_5469/g.11911 Transcript_5469/m.11911 type:complete len:114 (+) Transcript_5469:813-1154(+)